MLRTIYSSLVVGLCTFFWAVVSLFFCLFPHLRVKAINFCAHHWASWILAANGVKVRTVGTENIRPRTTYMVVGNHRSYLDIYVVFAARVLDCRMVAKKELTRIPIFGSILKRSDSIIVDRGNREQAVNAMKTAGARLRQLGLSIVTFAEGTRATPDVILNPLKKGGFILAGQLGIPVLPFTIHDTGKLQPKGALAIHPGTVTIVFGKPIPMDNYEKPSDVRPVVRRVQEEIESTFLALRAEAERRDQREQAL
ncbi:MAG: 1-acyl-sn-glycerol-3-phosphate acyltransferase [Deltaproteobacteria bacterium]|nr:1-acyl-sn-glycerol-3-phosphate acyltransferase [Candidatus Anaeroferrophillacea bacterium]